MTQEQFKEVYNKHLPKKYVVFWYKSKKRIIQLFLVILFWIGMILAFTDNLQTRIGKIVTLSYGILLLIVVMYGFIVVISNNIRIKKICKELNIDKYTYNEYVLGNFR